MSGYYRTAYAQDFALLETRTQKAWCFPRSPSWLTRSAPGRLALSLPIRCCSAASARSH